MLAEFPIKPEHFHYASVENRMQKYSQGFSRLTYMEPKHQND